MNAKGAERPISCFSQANFPCPGRSLPSTDRRSASQWVATCNTLGGWVVSSSTKLSHTLRRASDVQVGRKSTGSVFDQSTAYGHAGIGFTASQETWVFGRYIDPILARALKTLSAAEMYPTSFPISHLTQGTFGRCYVPEVSRPNN